MKNTKLSHLVALVAFGMIFVIWVLFIFWLIYPYNVLKVKQPYEVLTPEIHQGGILQYRVESCKYLDVVAKVRRQFVDGIVYGVPESSANLKKGCSTTINTIEIPQNLPTGKYRMDIEVIYKVNPIREITYNLTTDYFEVIK